MMNERKCEIACALMGMVEITIIYIQFSELIVGDRSPDIESDAEETQPFRTENDSNESSITPNADQFANFHVNLPARNDLTPSDYDYDFENFRVEFGRGKEEKEVDEEEDKEDEDEEVEIVSEPKERLTTETREVARTESFDKVSTITTERSSRVGEGGSVSSRENVVSKEFEVPRPRIIRSRPEKEREKLATGRELTRGEKRPMSTSGGTQPSKRKYMTPAAVISQYAKGNLTNSEAMDAIMKFRVNKMLPKKVDGVYMDKEEVKIPKGYSFAKHKKSKSKRGRIGLTRIEREIRAYQESTQMLIPRSIFARIVREIAQGWFKGEGQIKFTVEALAALQVATEDEIIRLLEISTACSYHAKRITLRVDDMRLARFCRGRQNYEFTNIN
ncbi:histone [Theileria orientalis strain Shintoku]|uniref:Histone n=1 Tax=Theileria orientalis strain Shintoku TaxID=869250 RepID=J4C7W7_THEOR|nr:histone [Theileria orientalis strain Shintoku]PVC50552.1 histone [Theileria orientalis]BAM39758.1 histone [Theileria orientalis strain Shintoku]|eukprot:XP_009690059.1 histone [Theileria orientalis strain Shintoku]